MASDFEPGRNAATFNNLPFMALEKEIPAHDLNPEEQARLDELRSEHRENLELETTQFNTPEVFFERRQAEFEKLLEQHAPGPDLTPPGGPTRPTDEQLLQQAHNRVQASHEGLIQSYNEAFTSGVNDILGTAAQDNRGPAYEHSQALAQDRGHDVQDASQLPQPGEDGGPDRDPG